MIKILKFFDADADADADAHADPGSENLFDPGSGIGKIRIWDKHPGSATLVAKIVA